MGTVFRSKCTTPSCKNGASATPRSPPHSLGRIPHCSGAQGPGNTKSATSPTHINPTTTNTGKT